MTLTAAAASWFASLRLRRRSAKTITWYAMWLDDLQRMLMFDDVAQVTLADLRIWLAGLLARQLSPASAHGAARTVKAFFRWCVAEELRPDDPTLRLEMPSLPKRIPKPLSPQAIQQLINVAAGSHHPERDQALIMFLVDSGVRLGELVGLQVNDVDLTSYSAVVCGKGDQERFVFFSDETARVLAAWLAMRPASASNLFGLRYHSVAGLLRRLAKRAHVVERVHPHALRKTAATRYAETVDVHTLKQLFGWQQLETSEHYVSHSRARLAERARAALQSK